VGDSGTILLTSNGGATWARQPGVTANMLTGVCVISADTALVVGANGILLRSTDGGISWEEQESGTASVLKGTSFADRNTGCVVGFNGTILWTNTWTDIAESEVVPWKGPDEFVLEQNYPNPFNPVTNIEYSLGVVSRQPSVATRVRLAVYDLLGREVTVLVNEQKAPGRYQVEFDGAKLSSGVYIYRLTAGNYTESKRMLLLR